MGNLRGEFHFLENFLLLGGKKIFVLEKKNSVFSSLNRIFTLTLQTENQTIIMEKKTYSYEEAFAASLKYFDGDELAARVWVNKYAMS